MKKGIALPFIIILASVALILGAFFLLDEKQKIGNQKSAQTASLSPPNETATWKAYKYKSLTFKYPSNWISRGVASGGIDIGGVASEDIQIGIKTDINYNIYTGKPYSSVKEFILGPDHKEVNTMQIDGIEALRSIFTDNRIFMRIFTRDKSNFYSIDFLSKKLTQDRKIFETIISSIEISDEPVDLTEDWKIYKNSSLKFVLKYPPHWKIKQNKDTAQFVKNEDEVDLTLTFNRYGTDYSSYPQCASLPDSDQGTECLTEANETLVGGKRARIFGYSAGVDSDMIIVQLFEPKIELEMYVASSGLHEQLARILSTFKFLDQPDEEKFCGGIAGIICPSGYECLYDGNYPDAGGKCIEK